MYQWKICFYCTDISGKDIQTNVVETWTFENEKKAELCEIRYSKERAAKWIQQFDGSIMYGPDLYHVQVDGKTEVNLWQPMHLPRSVELTDGTNSASLFTMIPVNDSVPVLLRTNMINQMEKKHGPVITFNNPEAKHLKLYLSLE